MTIFHILKSIIKYIEGINMRQIYIAEIKTVIYVRKTDQTGLMADKTQQETIQNETQKDK